MPHILIYTSIASLYYIVRKHCGFQGSVLLITGR